MNRIKKVQAIFDYSRKHNDELSFKKNDIITITQQIEGGWWEGTLNNLTGWFPSNYVQEIVEDSDKNIDKSGGDINLTNFQADIVNHILDGEKRYFSKLNNMLSTFMIPLIKVINQNESKMQKICDVLQSIAAIHKKVIDNIEEMKHSSNYRIGRLYLDMAGKITETYVVYSSIHLMVVYSLDMNRSAIMEYFETQRMAFDWSQIKQQLSLVFDRLARYPLLLKEMERYLEDGHPDRGDIQRAVVVFNDIHEKCIVIRKKKERDLDIICATILGWKGERLSQLGEPVLTIKVSYIGGSGSDDIGPLNHVLILMPPCIILLACTEQADVYAFKAKLPIEDLQLFAKNDEKDLEMRSELTGECLRVTCDKVSTRNELIVSIKGIQQKFSNSDNTDGVTKTSTSQVNNTQYIDNQAVNQASDIQAVKMRERSASREGGHVKETQNTSYYQNQHVIQQSYNNPSNNASMPPLRIIRLDPPSRWNFEQTAQQNIQQSPQPTNNAAGTRSSVVVSTAASMLTATTSTSTTTNNAGGVSMSGGQQQPHFSPKAARKKREDELYRIKDDALVLQVIESYCISGKGSNSLDLARLRLSDAEIIRAVGGGQSNKQHALSNQNNALISQSNQKRENQYPLSNQIITAPNTTGNMLNNNPQHISMRPPVAKQPISNSNQSNQSKPIGCAPMISGKNKKR